MALSQDIINQFTKMMTENENENTETIVNGTYKVINGQECVQIDGSDIWTPVTSTVEAEDGERVKVSIKNHAATITANITSPSASSKSVQNMKDEIDEYGNSIKQIDNTIIQQANSIIEIENTVNAQNNTINAHENTINQHANAIQQINNAIEQENNDITQLNNTIIQNSNDITEIGNTVIAQGNVITEHDNTIKQLDNTINQQGNIIEQYGNEIDQQNNAITQINNSITEQNNTIKQQGNTIEQYGNTILEQGNNIAILNSAFSIIDGELVGLSSAIIDELKTNHLDAEYATIDFANINMAAVKKLFTDSGIIKDLVVEDGKITGELVGVTIKGDLIEGNTIKADKLVVKGEDGIYYKLNIDGLNEISTSQSSKFTLLTSEPDDWSTNYSDYYIISNDVYTHITDSTVPTWTANTYYKLSSTYESGLDGSVIVAHSITADRISVTDLVAFGATIGGFNITSNAIYSNGKDSIDSIVDGLYMDNDGQASLGNATNYIKFFKDTDGQYKLILKVDEIYTSSESKSISEQISELKNDIPDVIIGTQTSSTSSWTGVASFDKLQDGQQIVYWLPRTSTSTSVTLNLTLPDDTTTGAINVYYSGTTRLTTHYAAGNCIRMIYKSGVSINGSGSYTGWWCDANYNTDTYDRIKYTNTIKAQTAIIASSLIVGDSDGYFKLEAGSIFDIDKPILWAVSAISAGSTGNNNYLAMPSCTIRNNTSSSWTGTQYEILYLVGLLDGNKFTVDSDTPFTTTKPTSDDGKYYISLGYMYSTYQIYLYPEHPLFKYSIDGFKSLDQVAYEANIGVQGIESDYLKESTFTSYKNEQIENDLGIKTRLSKTEVTIYGDPSDPSDPDALINQIQKVDNDVDSLTDRVETAEDTLEGTGLNDYDQQVKITQRFLNVETDVEQIKNIFKITGGTNLVQNSVGYFADSNNKPTMWDITDGTIYNPFGYDGDLTGLTASRGKLFCAKGTICTTPNNIAGLISNKIMSVSFKYRQGENASTTIKIFNGSVTFFEKTFTGEIDQWTEYTYDSSNDPVLANNSFLCSTNSLQISITSTNSVDQNGFEISDLMLNYGDVKPWELSSNEVYGAMIKISSLGIEVTATTANTKNFMTTDGILVYAYDPVTDTIIGTDPITKITDNGTLTNNLQSTGDIIMRNLVHTMINDSSNNNLYVEYIID